MLDIEVVCVTIVALIGLTPVYNNEEEGMKSLMLEKSPMHECDDKKV